MASTRPFGPVVPTLTAQLTSMRRSKSLATWPTESPQRHCSTISALNSVLNERRERGFFLAMLHGGHPSGDRAPDLGCPSNRTKPTSQMVSAELLRSRSSYAPTACSVALATNSETASTASLIASPSQFRAAPSAHASDLPTSGRSGHARAASRCAAVPAGTGTVPSAQSRAAGPVAVRRSPPATDSRSSGQSRQSCTPRLCRRLPGSVASTPSPAQANAFTPVLPSTRLS